MTLHLLGMFTVSDYEVLFEAKDDLTACLETQKISCPKCHIFHPVKVTNFVQNFNFRLNFVQNCEFRLFVQNAKLRDFARFTSMNDAQKVRRNSHGHSDHTVTT